MSTLPADQQERLAGLFRGLQAKTIDFQTFVRDAEAIMGPKFQDLLLLMRNQGARTAQMQQHQRPPEFGRPQMPAGSMLTGSPSNMVRSSHPMSVSGVRPGMKLPSSTTAPVSMSSPLSTVSAPLGTTASPAPDSNRNLALMRQYFAQQHSVAGSDSLGGVTGLSDILSFAMSPAMHQSGQQAGTIIQPGGPGPTLGTMHAPIAGHAADGSFEDVITRWRQIILNPAIPGEQLARLSMQLSAYGDLLVSPRGPMDSMSEEARSQQFVQISKLQALIAQRQFSRGPAQPVSQPVSRAESPKAEKKPKEPKKKIASSKPPKDPNAPAKAKKRSADSRKSGSPAPRTPSKKQRTAGDGGSEPDVEMQPESSALAGSVLSPDSALSASISSSRRQQGGSVTPVANRPGLLDGGRDTPGVYADSDDSLAAPVSRLEISRASTYGTAGDASGSDEDMSRADDRVVDYARSDSKGKGVEGDSTERDRAMQKESLRKSKDRREKERASSSAGPSGGGGGGGGMFVIEDVIRCTGVDLREESEIILENMMHHSAYRRPFGSSENDGPMLSVHVVDGVEISRDRSMAAEFANAQVMEALVAKICKRSHLRAVSADAVPYLTLALQDRLRSFMELVSAAAYHRTRTQTLPPPPLDPSTRLPLYKITPHLDVKKQLVVLERVDRMREQARQQQLSEREQRNVLDHQQQHDSEADARQVDDGGDLARDSVVPPFELAREGSVDPSAAGGGNDEFRKQGELPVYGAGGDGGDPFRPASGTKRGRKKDDGIGETAAYTSKNMPDDIRNKISNQTALRAAGGIRKSWMTSGSADWLNSASAMRTSSRLAPGTPNEQSSGITGTDDTPTSATFSLGTTPTRHMASTNGASSGGFVPAFDSGSVSFAHGHKRNRSSLGTASDFEGAAAASPGPEGLASSTPFGSLRASSSLLPLRSTSLSAPLLVTVRDCLFSLERERLGDVRVGRGGGDRVLIQAYNKYVHD
ncbi:hypothetical protein GGI04_000252 [Coemansia thaxteri]|nr:hypothetical protein GGI04_000252 [Coemansia thaxteri]KAJ2474343.1 hypothetical protein GGI02_000140 [Coemansia sp. RSA 2322]